MLYLKSIDISSQFIPNLICVWHILRFVIGIKNTIQKSIKKLKCRRKIVLKFLPDTITSLRIYGESDLEISQIPPNIVKLDIRNCTLEWTIYKKSCLNKLTRLFVRYLQNPKVLYPQSLSMIELPNSLTEFHLYGSYSPLLVPPRNVCRVLFSFEGTLMPNFILESSNITHMNVPIRNSNVQKFTNVNTLSLHGYYFAASTYALPVQWSTSIRKLSLVNVNNISSSAFMDAGILPALEYLDWGISGSPLIYSFRNHPTLTCLALTSGFRINEQKEDFLPRRLKLLIISQEFILNDFEFLSHHNDLIIVTTRENIKQISSRLSFHHRISSFPTEEIISQLPFPNPRKFVSIFHRDIVLKHTFHSSNSVSTFFFTIVISKMFKYKFQKFMYQFE